MAYMLITVRQSNSCLEGKEDWYSDCDFLDKEAHIQEASYYTRATWTCSDIDWDTVGSDELPEDIVCAISRYAYHSFKGTLYDEGGDINAANNVKKQTAKAGSLDGSVEYFENTKVSNSQRFADINNIFKHYCSSNSGASRDATRV